MLKPGIKIGPQDWKSKLENSQAQYCEVWFRVDKPHWYTTMFNYLKKHRLNTGLHFWAQLDHNIYPNIAYNHPQILLPTLKLIKQTIDIAGQNHFHYVNIHAGNNFAKKSILPSNKYPKIPLQQAKLTQETSIKQLHQYAKSKNVLLLTETITAKLSPSWYSLNQRLKPINHYSLPVSSLIKLSHQGYYITNDIAHTFCDEFNKPLDYLSKQLFKKTKQLAPQTRLLHLSTTIPPFNGTDTHHGITSNDFKVKGIFPTYQKLKTLLRLFKNRNDVWVINEPRTHHVDNFLVLKQLISEL
jgi:hypothetical protein